MVAYINTAQWTIIRPSRALYEDIIAIWSIQRIISVYQRQRMLLRHSPEYAVKSYRNTDLASIITLSVLASPQLFVIVPRCTSVLYKWPLCGDLEECMILIYWLPSWMAMQ